MSSIRVSSSDVRKPARACSGVTTTFEGGGGGAASLQPASPSPGTAANAASSRRRSRYTASSVISEEGIRRASRRDMAGSGYCDWTICPEVISGRKVARATLDPRLLRCGILAVAARRSAWPAIPRLVDPSACPSWRRPLCRKQTTSAKSRTPMSRVHNFAAGPATLPESVLRQAQEEMLDWHGVGASIVELSHRGPEFIQVATEAEADLRRLMSIPDDYAVLFLGGGATTVQALLPLNFAAPGQAADYVLSGH